MKWYYQAGSFLENSPISDLRLQAQIPDYTCPACGSDNVTTHYNYPNLDVREVVTDRELKSLGPAMRSRGSGEEMADIVWRLRRQWNVPVSAGSIFGATWVKVTSKPTTDFHVLVGHAGFLCTAAAAAKMREAGIPCDWVKTPAGGKYASDADYVELIVPVAGRQKLPPDRRLCGECLRYSPGGSFRTVLLDAALPESVPFFKTIEGGVLILSSTFISTVTRIGLSGFVEAKTLIPVPVASEEEPWAVEQDRHAEQERRKSWAELRRNADQARSPRKER